MAHMRSQQVLHFLQAPVVEEKFSRPMSSLWLGPRYSSGQVSKQVLEVGM